MQKFVVLANDYICKYDVLRKNEKKTVQWQLHSILTKMSVHLTYTIGGTLGQSWTAYQLFCFYKLVEGDLTSPENLPSVESRSFGLPQFSHSSSGKGLTRQEVQMKINWLVLENLSIQIRKEFSVIFQSPKSEPLNVPPRVPVPVATPRKGDVTPRKLILHNLVHTPVQIQTPLPSPRYNVVENSYDITPQHTPRSSASPPSTPRTPLLQNYSKWLLHNFLSEDFFQFLQQQSVRSQSEQLKKMFMILRFYCATYGLQLFIERPDTIRSLFQDLWECPVVKTALELYHGKPVDGCVDLRIVTESDEEKQKLFFEYLIMIINLKVWLCHYDKPEFSAECAGKLWVFDDKTYSFKASNLAEQLPAA